MDRERVKKELLAFLSNEVRRRTGEEFETDQVNKYGNLRVEYETRRQQQLRLKVWCNKYPRFNFKFIYSSDAGTGKLKLWDGWTKKYSDVLESDTGPYPVKLRTLLEIVYSRFGKAFDNANLPEEQIAFAPNPVSLKERIDLFKTQLGLLTWFLERNDYHRSTPPTGKYHMRLWRTLDSGQERWFRLRAEGKPMQSWMLSEELGDGVVGDRFVWNVSKRLFYGTVEGVKFEFSEEKLLFEEFFQKIYDFLGINLPHPEKSVSQRLCCECGSNLATTVCSYVLCDSCEAGQK